MTNNNNNSEIDITLYPCTMRVLRLINTPARYPRQFAATGIEPETLKQRPMF